MRLRHQRGAPHLCKPRRAVYHADNAEPEIGAPPDVSTNR